MSDTRLGRPSKKKASRKKASRRDAELARHESDERRSRREDDREQHSDRAISDDQRIAEFRKQFYQSVLPDLPTIPGYHVCWLTTTNPRDSIAARVRLGYTPIRADELPGGWDFVSLKTGEYEGCIGVNEMVAFKLPLSLYEAYMREAHYEQPLAEERKLSSIVDVIKDAAEGVTRNPVDILVEEGTADLGKARKVGSFAEDLGEV